MFLKKIDGPRIVKLADGRVISHSDLPPGDTKRWVASRKEIVVLAVHNSLVERSDVLDRYSLSEEELETWESALFRKGLDGLKVTHR